MHIWNTVINYFVDLVSLRHLLDVSNFYFRMLRLKGDQPSGQHLHRTAGRLFGHFLNEQIMRNVQILELSMLGFRVDGLLNQYAQWKISDCYLFLKWNWTSNISKIFHSCERICQLSITLLHETFLSEDDWLEVEKGVKRLSHLKVTGSVTPMTLAVLCRILK